MTHPAQALIPVAQQQAPALVEQYRTIWSDLWANRGGLCREMEDVRAVVLGFLVDGVPADTARSIATEYMKGLAK